MASGLWLGKEGPLVHVACCCADLFLRLFNVLNDNEGESGILSSAVIQPPSPEKCLTQGSLRAARKREVLSAAAAAGISVAFGAPLGGVLFSLEQLSYYFPDKTMWQSFVCAMIAAVTLQAFNPFRTGKLVLYQVTYSTEWHAFELVPFAFLGVLGGLYGALFIKLNMRVAKLRNSVWWISSRPVPEVVVVALVTALVNYPNRFMRAQSTELVATLFSECSELTDEQLGLCGQAPAPAVMASLLAASFLGFLLASMTFGLQIPAGIILPSMAIGALYGRAVGTVARTWHFNHPLAFIFAQCEPDKPCVTAGTYAIIGAASALGGATRMTVSIVVIMFELTGALTYVLPIMISVLISKWVGDAFGSRGIYEAWIAFNGYPFLDSRSEKTVAGPTSTAAGISDDAPIKGLMTTLDALLTLTATGHNIDSLEKLLAFCAYRGFPVIFSDLNPILLGYISRADLEHALSVARTTRSLPADTPVFFAHQPLADPSSTLDLRPWMDQTPITLNDRSSLQLTASLFLRLGLRYVMLVERGQLKGLLTKKDIWILLGGGGGSEAAEQTPSNELADGLGLRREQAMWSRDEQAEGEGEAEDSGLLRVDTDGAMAVEGGIAGTAFASRVS